MKTLIFLLIFFWATGSCLGQERPGVISDVSVDEFKFVMDSLKDEVLIDLRTPDELKLGKIPGALVIDYFGAAFEPTIEKLDKDKVYLLYCAGGGRSGETAGIMSKLGFKKVYNLESGFNGWVKKKMPVEKK